MGILFINCSIRAVRSISPDGNNGISCVLILFDDGLPSLKEDELDDDINKLIDKFPTPEEFYYEDVAGIDFHPSLHG